MAIGQSLIKIIRVTWPPDKGRHTPAPSSRYDATFLRSKGNRAKSGTTKDKHPTVVAIAYSSSVLE
ncbi:hypothetical protein [Bradyrhizobium lablabi]|uniref:hypothetical protein n=1 Tax=Bradyrhizobium lablabi TaxID=722472 RepID=UPI001FD89394|nr:hypothetical protein [Bradyrhizobium lablabi]